MQLPFRGQVQTQHALESRSSTSAISELPDPRPSSMRRPHSKIQNSITAPADAAIGVKPLAPNPDDPSRRPRDRRSPPRSRPSHNSLVRRGSPPPAVPPTAGLHRADARTLSCSRTFVPFVIRLPSGQSRRRYHLDPAINQLKVSTALTPTPFSCSRTFVLFVIPPWTVLASIPP
jgi:hypothetical protein